MGRWEAESRLLDGAGVRQSGGQRGKVASYELGGGEVFNHGRHEWHGWDGLNGSHGDTKGAEVFSHRLKRIREDMFPPVGQREETVSRTEEQTWLIMIFGWGHPGKNNPLKSSLIGG